jgi:hypothetical protein
MRSLNSKAVIFNLSRLRGIQPKPAKKEKVPKSSRSTESKSETSEQTSDLPSPTQKVAVNYRELNNYKQPTMEENDLTAMPVNNVADVLSQVKHISEGNTTNEKPLVITAKHTSPHVQVELTTI